MEQLSNFGDERQLARCVYCGDSAESRDHVPSRVLLDDPLPTNLPVVPACESCNQGFSLDEQYVACLVDCAVAGGTSSEVIPRRKVRSILARTPALSARVEAARAVELESARVRNVALKLARGHAAFELNEPQFGDPSVVTLEPLICMEARRRNTFESPPRRTAWPEVGSRAMQRIATGSTGWIVVQSGRYRYMAVATDDVVVRFVLSEYLACEILW